MKVIPPSVEILDPVNGAEILRKIELCGRVCYKSEDKVSEGSAERFVGNIIKSGHESVLEHASITVRFICDRGVTHEIVRHRIASYSQESTRYCNYSHDKFGNELTFIKPCYWNEGSTEYSLWTEAMAAAERSYFALTAAGASPQEARAVLPNSLKTELVVTMNLREWRHFFCLRTAERAHPQMREVARLLLNQFRELIPVVFDDIA